MKRIRALRDNFPPVFLSRLPRVDRDDAAPGRVQIGLKEQHRSVVAYEGVLVLEVIDQLRGQTVRLGEVTIDDAVPLVGSHLDLNDEETPVLGNLGKETPIRMILALVHQYVVGLRTSKPVVIQLVIEIEGLERGAFFRLIEAAVEKTLRRHASRRLR